MNDSTAAAASGCQSVMPYATSALNVAISVLGLALNSLNVGVFAYRLGHQPHDCVRFLLLKAVCDTYYALVKLWPFVLATSAYTSSSYGAQVALLVVSAYGERVATCVSLVINFLFIYRRLRMITQRFDHSSCRQALSFRWSAPCLGLAVLLLYVFKLFSYDIVATVADADTNSTSNYNYQLVVNSFGRTGAGVYCELAQSVLVNCTLVLLLFATNVRTLVEIRASLRKKSDFNAAAAAAAGAHSRSASMHAMEAGKRIKSAEMRSTMMVIWTTPLIVFGNLLAFCVKLAVALDAHKYYEPCVAVVAQVVYDLSFSVEFAFYYAFNVYFKQDVHAIILAPFVKHFVQQRVRK